MNIFFLSEDPYEAASMQVDRHVVKMILESAQLLSTAHRILDGDDSGVLPDYRDTLFYRATHKNHPSARWIRESVENYNWLVDHFDGLLREYTHRYKKQHACMRNFCTIFNHLPRRWKNGIGPRLRAACQTSARSVLT
jgi:hypothetical protein